MAKKSKFRPAYKARLCKNFDIDGNPVDGGCPRTAPICHFIHPCDPEWQDHPDRDRHNRDTYSSARSSRYQEPQERDQGWGRRASKGEPMSHTTQDSLPSLNFVAENAGNVPPTLIAPPPLPKIDTSLAVTTSKPSLAQDVMQTEFSASPEFQFAPTPSALGPPPTVPDAPGFEDVDILGLAPDVMMDERKQMWAKRVKLLSDAVKAYQAAEDAKEEKIILGGFENRPGLLLAGSEGKETVLEVFTKALQAQTSHEDLLKTKVDEIVDNLVSSDVRGVEKGVWPMSLAEMEEELSKQGQYNEIVGYVRDIRSAAVKIWESLDEEVRKDIQPPDIPSLSQTVEYEAQEKGLGNAMDVDVDEKASRQETRSEQRNLNDGTAEDIASGLWDKIAALDEALQKLEKRQEDDEQLAYNSVEEMIDMRFQEFQESVTELQLSERDLSSETRQHLTSVTEGIAKADSEIRRTTNDLEEYPSRLNTLIVEYPAAIQAYADACQRRDKNQRRIAELFAEQGNTEQSLATLQNAFRALMSRPEERQLSPPVSPPLPSCEVIVEAVEDGLRESLRAGLREEVEAFRKDVTARMESEVGILIAGMMNKVGRTVGIIGNISDRLDEVQGPRQ